MRSTSGRSRATSRRRSCARSIRTGTGACRWVGRIDRKQRREVITMQSKFFRRRMVVTGVAVVVVVLAVGWFASWYWSFEARFARSKGALEAYRAEVMANDPGRLMPLPPQRLGAFKTRSAERLPHGF